MTAIVSEAPPAAPATSSNTMNKSPEKAADKKKKSGLLKMLKHVGSSSSKKQINKDSQGQSVTSVSTNSSTNQDSHQRPFAEVFMTAADVSHIVEDDEISIIPDDVDVDDVIDAQEAASVVSLQPEPRHSSVIDVDEIPKTILSMELREEIRSSPRKNKRGLMDLTEIVFPSDFEMKPFTNRRTTSSSSRTSRQTSRWLLGLTAVAATVAFYAVRPRRTEML